MKTGAILLSGGYSSRMDGFKPLMKLGGQTLLERAVRLFIQSEVTKIVVVTGHRKTEVKDEAARLGIKSVYNKEYDNGMYSSVCAGVRKMKDMDRFFLLPVDIPLIRFSTLIALCNSSFDEKVLYPTFSGKRGHPPLISSALIPVILKFDGNGGLRTLLEQFPGRDVAVWDEGILLDADTPEDFVKLEKRLQCMDVGSCAEAKELANLSMKKRGVDHGLAVADIACTLGRELKRKGCVIDMDCLFNSALLHDIAKGEAHHEARGAQILKDLGLSHLAPAVGAHRDATVPKSGKISEIELVCLADKLVRGTTQMSVEKRFEEKLTMYADNLEACKAIRKRLAHAQDLKDVVEKKLGRSLEKVLRKEKKR